MRWYGPISVSLDISARPAPTDVVTALGGQSGADAAKPDDGRLLASPRRILSRTASPGRSPLTWSVGGIDFRWPDTLSGLGLCDSLDRFLDRQPRSGSRGPVINIISSATISCPGVDRGAWTDLEWELPNGAAAMGSSTRTASRLSTAYPAAAAAPLTIRSRAGFRASRFPCRYDEAHRRLVTNSRQRAGRIDHRSADHSAVFAAIAWQTVCGIDLGPCCAAVSEFPLARVTPVAEQLVVTLNLQSGPSAAPRCSACRASPHRRKTIRDAVRLPFLPGPTALLLYRLARRARG